MMEKYLVIIILSSSFGCFGQMNVDSLAHYIRSKKEYTATDTINYLLGSFLRYEDKEGYNSYDLYLDSMGNIAEYLRVAIVHTEYDNKNRLIKREGYSLNGNFNLWDYPPIQMKHYNSDSTTTDTFNHNYELVERTLIIKDTRGREIE